MKNSIFVSLLYGFLTMTIFLVCSSFIVAIFLRFTNMSPSLFTYITLTIGLLALFFGGFIAGVKRKMNGWFVGLLTALLFSSIVFFVQFLGYNLLFTTKQMFYHFLYMIAAICGSMLGVNSIKLNE